MRNVVELFYAYTYDCKGNLVTETDSTGTLQEKHSYRADGKLAESQFADGNELIYSYGVNGQEREIQTARSRQKNQAAQEYTYDARGRITGIRDGNQNRTGYRMDSWGRVHQIDTAEGGEEKYTYDYAGHVTSTTDANGGVITYRYNSQGKVYDMDNMTIRSPASHNEKTQEERKGRNVKSKVNIR